MKAKLMSINNYKPNSRACECVWLLRQIKAVMYKFEGQRDIFLAMGEARSTLDRCKQQPHKTNAIYFDQLKSLVDAFEHYGGTIGGDKGLIDTVMDINDPDHPGPIPTNDDADAVRTWIKATSKYNQRLAKHCRDMTLAMMYLQTVDRTKYGDLWISLQNQHSRGNLQYPKDLSAAYSMVAGHKTKHQAPRNNRTPQDCNTNTETGLSFLQSLAVAGTNGVTHAGITCFRCNSNCHYISACPTRPNNVTGIGLLQIGSVEHEHSYDDPDIDYGIMFT
jgi:hypothetical protein